jgi:hypothetical protein
MLGNRHDQVRANRSNRQRFADDDLHNGKKFNYYDKPSKKEVMSESDEHSNKNQIRSTNKSKSNKKKYLTDEPNFDSYPSINMNNMAQITKRSKKDTNTSKNIDKTYSFEVNHSGN